MAKYRITPSSRAIVQSPISIGHKAEKGVEAIEFDLTAWVETYGSGTLTVIMRRWGDAAPYPIALEIDENNKATWTLSNTDTAKAGMAYAQLSYIVGETVVKKSDIYTFRVMDSLTGEGDPPEAYESWLEHLTHLAAEAMAEVLDIESIVTDKTLTVDGGIADAKATGNALALKADKSTTYTKTEVDQMIEDVEVETDTTLAIAGAPADAKKVGDELSDIKADLDKIENLQTTKSLNVEWEIGTKKTNGSPTQEVNRKRIVTASRIKFIHPANLTIESGYKYCVWYYATEDSVYYDTTRTDGGNSGWIESGTDYTVDANTWCNISIAKISESGSYEAVVDTWKNYILEIIGGLLVLAVNEANQKADANSQELVLHGDRLTILENKFNKNELPTYWETYFAENDNNIIDKLCAIGNHGVTYVFFTDYHYVQSEYNYQDFTWLPLIMKHIKDKYPVNNFIFGGDILTKNATRLEALQILEKFREDYGFLRLKNIVGNHETNPYGSEQLEEDDIYSILFRGMGMEDYVNLDPDMYWYCDNKIQKVRYIALNTGLGTSEYWNVQTEQHEWIINTLKDTPDGYHVIILPHVMFSLSDGNLVLNSVGMNIKTIIDAYANRNSGTWNTIQYDFTNSGGTIACIMTGHTHNDGVLFSEAGYPIIATVCDAMWGSNQNVARGTTAKNTVNEHAFDIVCIDTTAKTIKCVRIGSGSDRNFTYT